MSYGEAREPLLDPPTVAEWLNVNERTLTSWRVRGGGPAWIRVGRQVRYDRTAILAWLDEQAKAEP